MSITFFDSRNPRYRSPFGAVSEGTKIHFRICLPRHISCSAATLVVHNELTGENERSNMFWCGMEGYDAEWWEVDYTPEKAALYFYWFELNSPSSARAVGKTWAGKGELTANPAAWQLTVYEKDFKTPDWLAGGIMYQIFPDSFCRSGKEHENVPPERVMHSWGEQPHWRPDPDGEYRNNHYFGGDLAGIESKLDYIRSLGVTCIYLNPIFEAHENHRYNTADYSRIDPLLGTEKDFISLCAAAEKRGMRVILDGVFSHTGCDSIYFNKYNRYASVGAYNSPDSPYRSWYNFRNWPHEYDSWWGFKSLPELCETDDGVMEFLTGKGKGGIVGRWLGKGACGWRLDVADELPDKFLDSLRAAAKNEKPDAVVIGEVWEDASNKSAYSVRRRYLLGKQLDSVMNYCFKDAILGFLTGVDAASSMEIIMNVLENYPPQVTRLLMNLIGTHDTERAITILAGDPAHGQGREWQSCHHLNDGQRAWGRQRYRLATVLQYTLPGVPSIYYGDETGVEGYKDPFNRSCYPWGNEDTELIEWHKNLAAIRGRFDCFADADFTPVEAQDRFMSYIRRGEKDSLLTAVNAGDYERVLSLPEELIGAECVLGSYDGGKYLRIPANSAAIIAAKRS